uniref:Intraflagellar transport protein 46 homolog n=1 Tax=Eubosmina coregoni TaxID=186181 RepID=A0A4Y7LLR3_9CRUS|nr:EOG090X0FP3 [Eubosmina coregoni]
MEEKGKNTNVEELRLGPMPNNTISGDDDHRQDVIDDDFNSINVSVEIKQLFQYIQAYHPQQLEVETNLKPFLPDYIPAVGDPDAFLKVDRPDGIEEKFGLFILDEPSLEQAEKSILDLQLRSLYKQSSAKKILAKTVQDANKTKAIDKWIKDISDLHRSKPTLAVTFSRPLPDIDALLVDQWSEKVKKEFRFVLTASGGGASPFRHFLPSRK